MIKRTSTLMHFISNAHTVQCKSYLSNASIFKLTVIFFAYNLHYNQTRSFIHQASKIQKQISDIYAFKNLTFVSYYLKVFFFHQKFQSPSRINHIASYFTIYMIFIYLGYQFLLFVLSCIRYIKWESVRLHLNIESYVTQN